MNWQLDVDPDPTVLVLPPDAESLDEANLAIEFWEFYSGKTLDPTQRLYVQMVMAERPGGRWAARTTARAMPRQNGKGDELEVPEFWGLVQRGEAILHTIHDAVLLATQTQQRMLSLFEHRDLRPKIKRKWMGTGQQMIELRNGGIIWYRTRTGGGGRGIDDISRLVVDEAQHATQEQLGAITSILFANDNPQMNIAGTAALAGKSEWWWSQRLRALSDSPGAFAYMEHAGETVTVEPDGSVTQDHADPLDREVWRATNPAIACGRQADGMEFLEEELRVLGVDLFAQEHLCVWAPPPSLKAVDVKLPAEEWASTVTDYPPHLERGQIAIGWEVAKDGAWSSIGIAAGDIRQPYVELVEHRQGTGWLPGRLVELVQKWDPISVGCIGAGPSGGQVGAVLAAFRDAGIDADLLDLLSMSEYRAACGGFYSDVVEGRLTRPGGQGPLDVAAGDASARSYGDAWVWEQRDGSVPITPMVAVTVARSLLPTEVAQEYDPLMSVL